MRSAPSPASRLRAREQRLAHLHRERGEVPLPRAPVVGRRDGDRLLERAPRAGLVAGRLLGQRQHAPETGRLVRREVVGRLGERARGERHGVGVALLHVEREAPLHRRRLAAGDGGAGRLDRARRAGGRAGRGLGAGLHGRGLPARAARTGRTALARGRLLRARRTRPRLAAQRARGTLAWRLRGRPRSLDRFTALALRRRRRDGGRFGLGAWLHLRGERGLVRGQCGLGLGRHGPRGRGDLGRRRRHRRGRRGGRCHRRGPRGDRLGRRGRRRDRLGRHVRRGRRRGRRGRGRDGRGVVDRRIHRRGGHRDRRWRRRSERRLAGVAGSRRHGGTRLVRDADGRHRLAAARTRGHAAARAAPRVGRRRRRAAHGMARARGPDQIEDAEDEQHRRPQRDEQDERFFAQHGRSTARASAIERYAASTTARSARPAAPSISHACPRRIASRNALSIAS